MNLIIDGEIVVRFGLTCEIVSDEQDDDGEKEGKEKELKIKTHGKV